MSDDSGPLRPLLRVVKGDPTPEELAALVAVTVVAGRPPAASPRPATARSPWGLPARAMGAPLHFGPGAWRASAW